MSVKDGGPRESADGCGLDHPAAPPASTATRRPFYPTGAIFTPTWDRPTIIFPGAVGGGNWGYDSFSPDTGLVYVGYSLIDTAYSNGQNGLSETPRPYGEYMAGGLAAVDPRTNTVVWRRPNKWWLSLGTGVLSTAGGLLFQGRPDGTLAAMDAATGEEIWTWQCGAGANTCPIRNAMAPQALTIAAGTTVTFTNPAGNEHSHGAVSFFGHEFGSQVLTPGQSFTHTFRRPGQYYYNDPVFPQNTGLIMVT
jgi:glucose dehydrogenase